MTINPISKSAYFGNTNINNLPGIQSKDRSSAAGKTDKDTFTLHSTAEYLSENEKSMIDKMMEFAKQSGLSTGAVVDSAISFALDKSVAIEHNQERPVLNEEYFKKYLSGLQNEVKYNNDKLSDVSVIQALLENFDKFKS